MQMPYLIGVINKFMYIWLLKFGIVMVLGLIACSAIKRPKILLLYLITWFWLFYLIICQIPFNKKNWKKEFEKKSDFGFEWFIRPEHYKKTIQFIQNLLNQKDKELKEYRERNRKAKILTAKASYEMGKIAMKKEIREMIKKMIVIDTKRHTVVDKYGHEAESMEAYNQALEDLLKHLK